jgi:hypothetical protein
MRERPIGVTILAILAGFAAVLAAIHALQFLGLIPFVIGPSGFHVHFYNFWYALMYGLLVWVYIWLTTQHLAFTCCQFFNTREGKVAL